MPLLPLPVEQGEGLGMGLGGWLQRFLTVPLTLAVCPQPGRGNS
jgi:hypothetical protein